MSTKSKNMNKMHQNYLKNDYSDIVQYKHVTLNSNKVRYA